MTAHVIERNCAVCIKSQVFLFPLISLVSLVLLFCHPYSKPELGKYFVKSRQKVGPHTLAKLAEKWLNYKCNWPQFSIVLLLLLVSDIIKWGLIHFKKKMHIICSKSRKCYY